MTLDQHHRWMVIWTGPGAEFDVREKLRKLGLNAFVPLVHKQRPMPCCKRTRGSWFKRAIERPETVLVPAFPRYILFSATDQERRWQLALHVDGVSMVVRQAGDREVPGLLPHAVARMLCGRNGDGVLNSLAETVDGIERFAAGANIVVTSGPFQSFPGVVVGREGRNIRGLLSLFNRPVEVTLAPESIQLTGT